MECEPTTIESDLAQGDIFVAHHPSKNWDNPWTRYGVVLTADCDIAQNKNDSKLVYIPIINHETYLQDVWLPQKLNKVFETYRGKLANSLARCDSKLQIGFFERHLDKGNPDRLLAVRDFFSTTALSEQLIIEIGRSSTALDEIVNLIDLRIQRDFASNFRDLCPYLNEPTKSAIECANLLKAPLLSANLPTTNDMGVLTRLIGLDDSTASADRDGFIIPLRHFRSIDMANVVTDKSAWFSNEKLFYRACRLRPNYRFDLVNKFANMFVRVGLEDQRKDDYSSLSATNAKHLGTLVTQ